MFSFPALLLSLLAGALLISPAISQLECSKQTFSTKSHYDTCSDLPYLNAFLHWSYNESKSTLSVAFIAPPAADGGWIAWGVNPTGTGMIGTQALIAFKDPQGKIGIKTYNLTSYAAITQTKLSFKVLDSRAEAAKGVMRIFATVEIPKNSPKNPATVNQVWQVGASVKDGVPQKHDFAPDNLAAKATLMLTAGKPLAPAPSPASDVKSDATAPASGQSATGKDAGGASKSNTNLYALFTVIGIFGLLL